MKRKQFLTNALALLPASVFAIHFSKPSFGKRDGFIVANGETRYGESYEMKGVTHNILSLKISGLDTSGNLTMFEQTGLTPKGGPPLHIHLYQDEWFYVLEGEYLFQVGNDKYQLKPGDTIFLPKEIPHAFAQLSDRGKMIVTYAPAGKMEAFFKATDQWKSQPSADEIKKVFEDHDMKVVGPPLKV